jgi:S1-C subfamily serine protease
VKNSTAYIRTVSAGGMSSGSGFFIDRQGFVITNAHVLGFGPHEARIPLRVDVVQNSGELNERTLRATIYGFDSVLDLAILRVESPDPPEGLQFGRAAELVETQEVVIFGFPFGEQLGRNVSVNRTTVSSLRKVNGMVGVVQLAGGMNPGNSGGPVTNTKGEVIGVSVAGIRTADAICFAIPSELTNQFVHAQIATGGWIRLGLLGPPVPTDPNRPSGPPGAPGLPPGVFGPDNPKAPGR